MSAATEYRYHRLTWEEMNDAIAAQKVVVLPTGSTEQHGPHLPLEPAREPPRLEGEGDAPVDRGVVTAVGEAGRERPQRPPRGVERDKSRRSSHRACWRRSGDGHGGQRGNRSRGGQGGDETWLA